MRHGLRTREPRPTAVQLEISIASPSTMTDSDQPLRIFSPVPIESEEQRRKLAELESEYHFPHIQIAALTLR